MADIKQLNDNTPVKWKDLKENAEYAKQYVERKIAESASDTESKLDEVKSDIMNKVGTKVFIRDTEPESKNTIWIRPVNQGPMNRENLLDLNSNTNGYEYQANVDGVDYGVENAVSKPEQLTTTNYLFDIIK